MKKNRREPFSNFILFVILGSFFSALMIVDIHPERIVIEIDFSKIEEKEVKPVWNTLNIWDISFLNGSYIQYNSSYYHEKNFFVDHVNIMTATGGRSTHSNQMYFEDDNGTPYYDFTPILKAIDWVIKTNITATIVIGNTPLEMTKHIEANLDNINSAFDFGAFDANTGLPNNWTRYTDYIKAMCSSILNYTTNNINDFNWRIYTEPDNKDWLEEPCLDNYFEIYTRTFRAIRNVLSNATIEMGNFMEADPEKVLIPFMKRIINEAPDTIPDIVGFSCYGRGQASDFFRDIGKYGKEWHNALVKLGVPDVQIAIEEGQILSDEKGVRLWDGDGTEFGAAWNAGVFHECIKNEIIRYAQWNFYAGEVRSPSLNVIEMYEKLENEKIVNTITKYPIGTKEHLRQLDAISTINEKNNNIRNDKEKGHSIIYFADPNHYSSRELEISIELKNVPEFWVMDEIVGYLVDHSHSNFFWDQYKIFGQIPRSEFGGMATSVWDLNVGISLYGTPNATDFYLWAWEHRDNYKLETIEKSMLNIEKIDKIDNSNYRINFNFIGSSVLLLEYY